MKSSFKSSSAVVVLFLSFFGVLLSVADAGAATRIGVFDIHPIPDDDIDLSSMSGYEKYRKLCERYQEIFMSALSRTGDFDPVELKIDPQDYQTIAKAQPKKTEGYRPYYRRSMTGGTSGVQTDNAAFMKEYVNIRVNKAQKANCRYAIEGSVRFDRSSQRGIEAIVHLNVFDAETGDRVYFTGTGSAPSSAAKRASPSRSKKGKKDKDPASAEQTVKEKATVEAFEQAIASMRDEMAGDLAKVVEVKGNSIIINKGSASKVRVGDIYDVYTEAPAADRMGDVFGPSIGSSAMAKTIAIALIKVNDVREDSSTAEMIEGAGNIGAILAGDRIRQLSSLDADSFLSEVASGTYPPFPDKHPEGKRAGAKPETPRPASLEFEPLPTLPPGTIRIGVMRFDSKAEGISEAEASSLTDLFSRMLSDSDKIAVLERDRLEAIVREQQLSLSDVIDPATAAKVGKLAGCQYILLGAVTGIEEREFIDGRYIDPLAVAKRREMIGKIGGKAGLVLAGLELLTTIVDADKENVVTETYEVVTDVDARIVDVASSQITATFTEQGSAAQSDVVTQDMDGDLKGVEASYGSLQSRAIASAAASLSHKIREALTGEQVQISSVDGLEIIINRGTDSGVQAGDLFCVYSEGQSYGDTEAIISVTDVQADFSTAEIAKSITDPYSPATGYRLEAVSQGDFQRGIWHIKNQRRAQAAEKERETISLEALADGSGKKKRFEVSSTDTKKVIKSYGLDAKKEKALIDAHLKASKESSTKKKYESYKRLSDADVDDFLAAYNAGQHALKLSRYAEARELASKALFVNPRYRPARALIEKIDKGEE